MSYYGERKEVEKVSWELNYGGFYKFMLNNVKYIL